MVRQGGYLLENGVVGAGAHVEDGEEGDELNGGIVVVVARRLDEHGKQRQRRALVEEGHLYAHKQTDRVKRFFKS